MITAKEIDEMEAQLSASITDLGREYGIHGKPELQSDRAADVADHFIANADFDVNSVSDAAILRGEATMRKVLKLAVRAAATQQPFSNDAIAAVAALWMDGLVVGLALGRKFPAKP